MKTKEFKTPKTLAACVDMLYLLQEERYAIQKTVDNLKARESALKERLINELPKSEASGIAGRVARATIVVNKVPQVVDWDVLYKHVKKTGEFELLQRRVSDTAVKERWDADKTVPGVDAFSVVKVSLNKVK